MPAYITYQEASSVYHCKRMQSTPRGSRVPHYHHPSYSSSSSSSSRYFPSRLPSQPLSAKYFTVPIPIQLPAPILPPFSNPLAPPHHLSPSTKTKTKTKTLLSPAWNSLQDAGYDVLEYIWRYHFRPPARLILLGLGWAMQNLEPDAADLWLSLEF